MPINVVGFKWGESDDSHKYDYNALENIPTTDIGELDIDTSASSGTEDGDLYAAISGSSWTDTISNGVLKVKKLFAKIITQVKTNTTTIASHTTTINSHTTTINGLGTAATKAVANNLTTSAEGSVLDARQGKEIKDNLKNFKIVQNAYYGADTADQTHTFTLESNSVYLIVIARINTAATSGAYIVTAHSTTSNITTLCAGAFETISINSTTLTVKSSASYVRMVILRLGGAG